MSHIRKYSVCVGRERGYRRTKNTKRVKPSNSNSHSGKQSKFTRSLVREIVGFAPFERRALELLKNDREKRALKFLKTRVGGHRRGKKKREELMEFGRPAPSSLRFQVSAVAWRWFLYFHALGDSVAPSVWAFLRGILNVLELDAAASVSAGGRFSLGLCLDMGEADWLGVGAHLATRSSARQNWRCGAGEREGCVRVFTSLFPKRWCGAGEKPLPSSCYPSFGIVLDLGINLTKVCEGAQSNNCPISSSYGSGEEFVAV
ncbi:60S ribosomal protein L36 [Taenia crassiceps]|uniref:Large ribosomal subunit protein eL36 n=1 Tax=Taenia crassiceps TaxID=6207 RepID=A0ABR4QK21_9CEST